MKSKMGTLSPPQDFGPRKAPSKCSADTWGNKCTAKELFVLGSSISLSLLFNFYWKLARSPWLSFESFASLPTFSRLIFFHWPDVLMCSMHIPHLSLLSALSQSKMWNGPYFHWHSSVLGPLPSPPPFGPLTKPFMWRKLLIQDSDIQSRFT